MIQVIKNKTNSKNYDNQSYNEKDEEYISIPDMRNKYNLKEEIFGREILKEFTTTNNNIEQYCDRKDSEDKSIINIYNSLYGTMLLLSKLLEALEPIYYLPTDVENGKEIILELEKGLIQNGLDLDPIVYLFYDDFFINNFESLLMHSHSLLDKIAIYFKENKIFNNNINEKICFKKILTPSSRKKQTYYFSDLIKDIPILTSNNTNDVVLNKINSEIQKLTPLKNIIIPGEHKTLRNIIVHQDTILNLSSNIFAVYRYKNKLLKIDNFVEDIKSEKKYPPMVECIDRILKNIIDFNLNTINTILNNKFSLSLNTNISSNMPWTNPLFNHKDEILQDDDNSTEKIKMNTFDIGLNKIILQDFYYVKKELFNKF